MTVTLAELEERVRSGDETVTPEEIEHARGLARFAELRQVAAERRTADEEARQADADARRLRDAFLAEIPDEPEAHIAELREKATAALIDLETYIRGYNAVIRSHINGLRAAGRASSLEISASHPGDSILAWYVDIDGHHFQVKGQNEQMNHVLADARQKLFEADQAAER